MTQTRTFLLFAWLLVAFLLWSEWNKTEAPAAAQAITATTPAVPGEAIPGGTVPEVPATPLSGAAGAVAAPHTPAAPRETLTLSNDVLRLTIDARGGSVLQAELLDYPQSTADDAPPVRLLSTDPADYFVAQSGLVSATGSAPSHEAAFQPETTARQFTLAPGAARAAVPFVWTDPASGLTVRKVYTLTRGSYVVTVRDEISNSAATAWQGHVYRQLQRVEPPSMGSSITNPAAYSFVGAAWYSPEDHFEKRKFGDFVDGPLDETEPNGKSVQGGWIAMLQHHFLAVWVPTPGDATQFSLQTADNGRHVIREVGPALQVAPGASVTSEARLWVGPKLQNQLEALAPGLDRAVDYSSYAIMALLAKGLFWVLSLLEGLVGNWGWAIIGLVVLIKLAMYPLSAAQYGSMAKMRKFQPRLKALKERYGDDRQKYQAAMMELYKKEKINPAGGCLPVLVQLPIFLALYWVLLESVELRQAPWIHGWIENLSAKDPFFVLPALNVAIMFFTQKLTPMAGMDPLQRKLMQYMPLAFGVMFAFFPAGLVLYWVTNGALGLLQQWVIIRRHEDKAAATPAT